MTLNDALNLEPGPELDAAVCELMEPMPADVSAAELRSRVKDFQWYSCYDFYSPGGWWRAEIGTDHGPESADNDPVRWRPGKEPSEDISAAWQVEERIEELGITQRYAECLGAVCRVYLLRKDEWLDMWLLAHATPLQRCRAALKACCKGGEM